jgi:ribosomal protein S18 acetylase RimI-like enzyme
MTSRGYRIRRATHNDVPAVRQCVEAAYHHYIERIGKPPGPMLDDYAEVIRRHLVFIAEANDIAGILVLIPAQKSILLDNVAVHPGSQGRGLGKRLISFAESEARNLGFDTLDLYTHECMHENIALYRSLGYEETARREVSGYSRVYMRKPLA